MRKIRFLSVFVLLVLMLSTTLAMEQRPTDAILREEDVRSVLLDYSTSLSAGHVTNESYYSLAMRDLLQERRDFGSGDILTDRAPLCVVVVEIQL